MSYTGSLLKYINILVDHIGFKKSPLKEKYLKIVLEECTSKRKIENVIDRLIKERKLRFGGVKVRRHYPKYIRVTDLSEFAFCPASYSIKTSHILPPTIEMIEGSEEHEKYHLESFLNNIKNKYWENDYSKSPDDKPKTKFVKNMYNDLINSKIVYRGHNDENSRSFVNNRKNISGKPDYIMERDNSEKFVVEEKHTWGKLDINEPWSNHIIQIMGYINLLSKLEIKDGYVIYFRWSYFNNKKSTDKVRLFRIKNLITLKKRFKDTLSRFIEFNRSGKMQFDTDKLNLIKCYGCSARPWCIHKSGRFDTINFPYYHREK